MARTTKFITGTGAVAATLLPSASIFYGIIATSAEAASGLFVKLWWEGTGTAQPVNQIQPATTLPTPGTTVPHITIPVPTVTGFSFFSPVPINNGGRLWYWVTATAPDASTTVLATGGDVITLIYD